ncbi:uncharacterized [Tachysurus ichikawai]
MAMRKLKTSNQFVFPDLRLITRVEEKEEGWSTGQEERRPPTRLLLNEREWELMTGRRCGCGGEEKKIKMLDHNA